MIAFADRHCVRDSAKMLGAAMAGENAIATAVGEIGALVASR